jgi:hypothetical protein
LRKTWESEGTGNTTAYVAGVNRSRTKIDRISRLNGKWLTDPVALNVSAKTGTDSLQDNPVKINRTCVCRAYSQGKRKWSREIFADF